ncbi:uncharacterized protein [Diadema setosum]|uniref:uncharacterized protein n=1 Tax=Diadema setosum TaxID=31175 RepID=UPI003B3A29D5
MASTGPYGSSNVLVNRDVCSDANPGGSSLQYRGMLKEIDNGLGVRDMDKLRYLCQDLGVAPRKLETITRGIHLFAELEKLALLTPDDISLLVSLMQAINRFDLMKKLKSWSGREGNLAHRLSGYRRLMLKIADSLTRDEREQLRFYLSDGDTLPISVIEDCKTPLQLFSQMERYDIIGPDNVSFLAQLMHVVGNSALAKDIQTYTASPFNRTTSAPQLPPPAPAQPLRAFGSHRNSEPSIYSPAVHPSSEVSGLGLQKTSEGEAHRREKYLEILLRELEQSREQLGYPVVGQQPASSQGAFPERRNGGGGTQNMEQYAWYIEAVEQKGKDYADALWGRVMSMSHEDLQKKMAGLHISQGDVSMGTGPPSDTTSSSVSSDTSPYARAVLNEEEMHRGVDTSDSEMQARTAPPRVVPAQTATVLNQLEMDIPRYRMDRIPRGFCIIFNAKHFRRQADVSLSQRDGTERDVERLLNTFGNNLKFKTHVIHDPPAHGYINVLSDLQKYDHSNFDCFVCIILSHGAKDVVYGSDGKTTPIDAMTGLFRGEYCRSLGGKPKLFFIQACQGREAQKPVDIQQDSHQTLPNDADILVSLSTVPGFSSNRSVSQGSWYITTLCRVIDTYYARVDLLTMLTMVNQVLSQAADQQQCKQIGMPMHTLRKQIFFSKVS